MTTLLFQATHGHPARREPAHWVVYVRSLSWLTAKTMGHIGTMPIFEPLGFKPAKRDKLKGLDR